MENTDQQSGNKLKNITLGNVISWLFGILFLIAGFGTMASSIIGGVLVLVGAAILLPPVHLLIKQKLNITLSSGLRTILAVILVIIGVTLSSDKDAKTEVADAVTENAPATQTIAESTELPTSEDKDVTPAPVAKDTQAVTTPIPEPAKTEVTALASQTNRDAVLVTLKANASKKWGDDYQMVKFEYDNQVEAYDWVVAQSKYPDIRTKAKQKWGDDYQMVKFEYGNQVTAFEWVSAQTAHPDIMAKAKQKWGTDYQMVKFEYDNQVKAYNGL